jgi:predicted metal-binding protein
MADSTAGSTTRGAGGDLERLRRLAEKRGADSAVIIDAADVLVDPRVRLKCLIPKCFSSGACDHCPPHGLSARQMRETISRYRQGVFFRVLVPSSVVAARNLSDNIRTGVFDDQGNLSNLGGYYMLVFTILALLGEEAAKMGYPSSFGLAAGNCREVFCHFQPTCRKLMTGKGCRHPGLSAPSMEASGLDAFTMAARVGWDVFPIGGSLTPSAVPHGTLMGLILV